MINEIKKILEVGANAHHFPGGSFCVLYDGKIECDTVGVTDYVTKRPVTKDTIYDIASLSKVVSTTTMIMKLIEEKKLSLDSQIKDYVLGFRHEDITVYDLMIHSSGLPADIQRSNKLKSKEEVIEKALAADIIYPKHTKVVYSDIGYILLGLVIENITKKPINEYADEVIFHPLNMNETSYRPNKEKTAPTEFREDEVYHGLLQGMVHDEKSFACEGLSGHAGVFSTARDLARFIESILNEKFVINNDLLNELFKNRINYVSEDNIEMNRALGWQKPYKNGYFGENYDFENTIGHTGFTGCNMIIDRKHKLGFILLTNAVHPKRNLNQIFSYRKEIAKVLNDYINQSN
ncbi:serine hydrolase domain-containing protein [Acholeplasma hippikon]|uniref:Penicillin-binding protein E n=1 Tax=Acholeplasma hippikon TaxID=264636 RepID=A0A449BI33_9MOLU|nr:serine hydrolase domain-containing protein [Acholeplasma hippikon]VEU82114.1 Penicillin-binding protein E [Acholeplasma hippikon]